MPVVSPPGMIVRDIAKKGPGFRLEGQACKLVDRGHHQGRAPMVDLIIDSACRNGDTLGELRRSSLYKGGNILPGSSRYRRQPVVGTEERCLLRAEGGPCRCHADGDLFSPCRLIQRTVGIGAIEVKVIVDARRLDIRVRAKKVAGPSRASCEKA